MYSLRISPAMCRSDHEVESLRGRLPNAYDYEYLVQEDVIATEPTEGVLARLVKDCLSKKLVAETAKQFRTVHGSDPSNRGSIVYKAAMMNRERIDGSLSFSKAV